MTAKKTRAALPLAQRRAFARFIILPLLTLALSACSPNRPSDPKIYQGEGLITALDIEKNAVTIKHQDIKGLMPAMTMEFKVKPPVSLSGFSPNDRVRFELSVTADQSWISKLEYTGHIEPVVPGGAGPSATPPTPITAGTPFPDFTLTDENGKRWSLSQVRGKAVALTFIFTRCPLPEFCPRFSTNFMTAQQKLEPEIGDRFHLVSITFDPDYDKPRVLKEYGQRYFADFSRWTFLTGKEDDIRKITDHCGVRFWKEDGSVTHTAATAIIAPDGTLFKLYSGNEVTADEIAADLKSLADSAKPKAGAE